MVGAAKRGVGYVIGVRKRLGSVGSSRIKVVEGRKGGREKSAGTISGRSARQPARLLRGHTHRAKGQRW